MFPELDGDVFAGAADHPGRIALGREEEDLPGKKLARGEPAAIRTELD